MALGMWPKKMAFCQGGIKVDGSTKYLNELIGVPYSAFSEAYELKAGRKYYLNLPSPWPICAFPESIGLGGTAFVMDEPEEIRDPLTE